MEDATKGESPVEETPAPAQVDAVGILGEARAAIYAKADAIKAASEAPPAPEEPDVAPPAEKASATEEPKEAEPAEEAETLEQAKEKVRGLKVKVKLDGKEEVIAVDSLLDRSTKEEGRERALQRKAQELAREREAFENQRAVASQPSPVSYESPTPDDGKPKALRHWSENEVAAKYDEVFSESPYKAQQFLSSVHAERQRAQEESRKARMDTAERDYFTRHPEAEAPIRDFFADPKNFQDPDITSAFERGDYRGALQTAALRIKEKAIVAREKAIEDAQAALLAEEKKKTDLKKKGSVIRSASKPEVRPKEEWKPQTNAERIREMQAQRRGSMKIQT